MRNRLFLLLLFIFITCASTLQGRVINVPADETTIKDAIATAADGDIVLVAPGTYHEYDISFLGKAITVTGTDPTDSAIVAATVVDADSLGNVFEFKSGEDSRSVLTGLTLTRGKRTPYGGAVRCQLSSPTIVNNIIRNSSASGIYSGLDSYPIIDGNIIVSNGNRGGISVSTTSGAVITNNVIAGNSASDQLGGGGIYDLSSGITIRNNVIADNSAGSGWGGGIYLNEASPDISDNLFSGNWALYDGGGIYARLSSSDVSGNVFSDNEAGEEGGGISCYRSTLRIRDNLFTGNSADYGGALSLYGADSKNEILNNTIVGNSAVSGGGGIHSEYLDTTTVVNTILWDNAAAEGPEIWIGYVSWASTVYISYSDVEGGQSSVFVDTNCHLDWGTGMIDSDPLFTDTDAGDYHLQAGSPCIDTGDPSSRNVMWGGWRRDIGAFEYDQGFFSHGRFVIRKFTSDDDTNRSFISP